MVSNVSRAREKKEEFIKKINKNRLFSNTLSSHHRRIYIIPNALRTNLNFYIVTLWNKKRIYFDNLYMEQTGMRPRSRERDGNATAPMEFWKSSGTRFLPVHSTTNFQTFSWTCTRGFIPLRTQWIILQIESKIISLKKRVLLCSH